jgi:hypothetical protein
LDVATATDDATLLVVNEALDRLEAQDPMKASLVKLRFFVGFTAEESAPVLGVSVPLADACQRHPAIRGGINVMNGKLTCKAVADAHGLPFTPPVLE